MSAGTQSEMDALANLLAEVVLIVEEQDPFHRSYLEEIAERAQEHPSVGRVLCTLREDEQASALDVWRDDQGIPIELGCRVEQVGVRRKYGALRWRLHQRGQVLSYGLTRLSVRFDGEEAPVSVRPQLLRVIP